MYHSISLSLYAYRPLYTINSGYMVLSSQYIKQSSLVFLWHSQLTGWGHHWCQFQEIDLNCRSFPRVFPYQRVSACKFIPLLHLISNCSLSSNNRPSARKTSHPLKEASNFWKNLEIDPFETEESPRKVEVFHQPSSELYPARRNLPGFEVNRSSGWRCTTKKKRRVGRLGLLKSCAFC